MNLTDFSLQVPNFGSLKPRDKICLFAWFLHEIKKIDTIDNSSIRECYRELDELPPDISVYLPRLANKKPPDLIRVRGGYKLEGRLRRSLGEKFGHRRGNILVAKILEDLTDQIPDLSQRVFLSEAIDCYRIRAFRAAIVMTWNLAFDHLTNWLLADSSRIASFNEAILVKYPKLKRIRISKKEDFEEFKEREIVEICRCAKLISQNTTSILREKLARRNRAAHPSQVKVVQAQADDTITDLVHNVVLALK